MLTKKKIPIDRDLAIEEIARSLGNCSVFYVKKRTYKRMVKIKEIVIDCELFKLPEKVVMHIMNLETKVIRNNN